MRIFFALLFLITACATASGENITTKTTVKNTAVSKNIADSGYNIHVKIEPYKNCWIYLGSYYGKNKILVDSAWFNEKSESTFKGDKKLPGGIYFFVSPGHSLLFEILMDEGQQFTIKADSAHLENITVTGSKENELFSAYTRYLSKVAPQLNALQPQLQNAKTKADSAAIQQQQVKLNKELNEYRQKLIDENPESMVAVFFQSVKMPEIKTWPKTPDGKIDSVAAWRYMKEHFWDNINFNDNRLIRTPFFDPKLDDYFKYYVPAEPDSIISEVNYILLSARTGKDIYHYLLGKFTDKYINPEIMGQDKVFLFLFNNYFSKGDTLWLNEKQRKYIFDRAYSLIANQINEPAPQLVLKDTAGKLVSLYNIKAPFTFVVFWDPTCGHCKEQVPEVDSIYEAKWKALGVAVFAVNTNENTFEDWKQFIKEHHLQGWVHAWQTKDERQAEESAGQANYRQLYDIFQTPTMYLLDADKHIIAKKLSLQQYDAIIDTKLNSKTKASTTK
ncbi:MAG TPA: redoxin domain-containing protein [Chitinophagaceae bacterium]|nr:redoxin domain-containing protein [Chitinophagaceae bacterium]